MVIPAVADLDLLGAINGYVLLTKVAVRGSELMFA